MIVSLPFRSDYSGKDAPKKVLKKSKTNADIELDPNGTGTVDFQVVSQSTVGPAGIASALPATPSTYFKIKVNGVEYVVPAYAVA